VSALRREIKNYIDFIPDDKLQALKPILSLLTEELIIETDLTEEEKNL
jgi:hypothetical protein